MLRALSVLLATTTPPTAPSVGARPPTVTPFRTDVTPRVDPVFGDITSLRKAVDEFLALQAEMEKVRDEFSTAVHDTLSQLAPPGAPPAKMCPASVGPHYAKALEAGGRYLGLGRRIEGHFREIRRSDTLGDAVGLTPDYRWKVKKAGDLYQHLLRDYREMRVAFYDQLGAEMRHAGCRVATAAGEKPGEANEPPSDPANPASWELEPVADSPAAEVPGAAKPKGKLPEPPPGGIGPAIWIDIDNAQCGQPSRLYIDGAPFGTVAAKKKVSVRTRSGPHELCVLPESEKRACGEPGTVRRAYLYEGWTLSVRCEK